MPTSGGQDRADCADQFDTLPLGLGRQDEAAGPDLEMTFSGLRRPRAFTTCALGGGSGDLLGRRVACGSHESAGVGVERVGDVNEDLAGQRLAVVRDH